MARERPGAESVLEEDADDTPGVRENARRLEDKIKKVTIDSAVERMRKGIAAVEHEKSEPALTELGRLLGAEAFKPDGQRPFRLRVVLGRPRTDCHRCQIGGVPGPRNTAGRDVCQANTQLTQLAEDVRVPWVRVPEIGR